MNYPTSHLAQAAAQSFQTQQHQQAFRQQQQRQMLTTHIPPLSPSEPQPPTHHSVAHIAAGGGGNILLNGATAAVATVAAAAAAAAGSGMSWPPHMLASSALQQQQQLTEPLPGAWVATQRTLFINSLPSKICNGHHLRPFVPTADLVDVRVKASGGRDVGFVEYESFESASRALEWFKQVAAEISLQRRSAAAEGRYVCPVVSALPLQYNMFPTIESVYHRPDIAANAFPFEVEFSRSTPKLRDSPSGAVETPLSMDQTGAAAMRHPPHIASAIMHYRDPMNTADLSTPSAAGLTHSMAAPHAAMAGGGTPAQMPVSAMLHSYHLPTSTTRTAQEASITPSPTFAGQGCQVPWNPQQNLQSHQRQRQQPSHAEWGQELDVQQSGGAFQAQRQKGKLQNSSPNNALYPSALLTRPQEMNAVHHGHGSTPGNYELSQAHASGSTTLQEAAENGYTLQHPQEHPQGPTTESAGQYPYPQSYATAHYSLGSGAMPSATTSITESSYNGVVERGGTVNNRHHRAKSSANNSSSTASYLNAGSSAFDVFPRTSSQFASESMVAQSLDTIFIMERRFRPTTKPITSSTTENEGIDSEKSVSTTSSSGGGERHLKSTKTPSGSSKEAQHSPPPFQEKHQPYHNQHELPNFSTIPRSDGRHQTAAGGNVGDAVGDFNASGSSPASSPHSGGGGGDGAAESGDKADNLIVGSPDASAVAINAMQVEGAPTTSGCEGDSEEAAVQALAMLEERRKVRLQKEMHFVQDVLSEKFFSARFNGVRGFRKIEPSAAFIGFNTHEQAVVCLRWLREKPEIVSIFTVELAKKNMRSTFNSSTSASMATTDGNPFRRRKSSMASESPFVVGTH